MSLSFEEHYGFDALVHTCDSLLQGYLEIMELHEYPKLTINVIRGKLMSLPIQERFIVLNSADVFDPEGLWGVLKVMKTPVATSEHKRVYTLSDWRRQRGKVHYKHWGKP